MNSEPPLPGNRRKLRLTNVNFLNSAGFRHLEQTPWLIYQEASPMECARLLHEGETEVALVPVAEFARMGGYRPLSFGIAADGVVESVLLLSELPLSELDTILLDATSQTSVVLLKVILRAFYPELYERMHFERMPEKDPVIRGGTGALMIGDRARDIRGDFAQSIDLAELWKQHTGLPIVFAIWCGRSENLDDDTVDLIQEQFELAQQYREIYARDWAERNRCHREQAVQYVMNAIRYRLDAAEIGGLNRFFELAHSFQLLPSTNILSPHTETNPSTHLQTEVRNSDIVLHDARDRRRLSIHDVRTLVEAVPVPETLLAADLARVSRNFEAGEMRDPGLYRNFEIIISNVSMTSTRADLEFVQPGDAAQFVHPWDEIIRRIEQLPRVRNRQISIVCGLHPELDLDYFCWIIRHLKENFPFRISALSPEHVAYLARTTSLDIPSVIEKLKDAGLDMIGDRTSFLLLDRVRRKAGPIEFDTQQALSIYRAAHRKGLKTVAGFPVSPLDSWRDRFVHLEKLRKIQDETGGFSYLNVHPLLTVEDRGATPLPVTDYLLAVAVARLLVENIAIVETTPIGFGTPVAEISLHCGADIHIDAV